jgi:hypothetical protein
MQFFRPPECADGIGAGHVFPTRAEAISHASVLAVELAQDKGWGDSLVSVTDEGGKVIAQIAVPF